MVSAPYDTPTRPAEATRNTTFRLCLLIYLCLCDHSGHCKKLAPEYEAAAAVLAEQDPPRTIAKVDATEAKGLADRMQIKGFPTLYFFK